MWVLEPHPGSEHASIRASKDDGSIIQSSSVVSLDLVPDSLKEDDVVHHGLVHCQVLQVLPVEGLVTEGQCLSVESMLCKDYEGFVLLC